MLTHYKLVANALQVRERLAPPHPLQPPGWAQGEKVSAGPRKEARKRLLQMARWVT